MEPKQNDLAAKQEASKAAFAAYLEKSTERRRQMEADLVAAREKRAATAAEEHQRAQAAAEAEEAQRLQAIEEREEFRQAEIQRRKDIEADKAARQHELDLLEEKREAKREYERKRKEYMRDMKWAGAIKRLRERRKQEAQEARIFGLEEADRWYKEQEDRISTEHVFKDRDAESTARQLRGEAHVEFKKAEAAINDDIQKRKAKLYAHEQMELSNIGVEMQRKFALVKTIGDISLRQRQQSEYEREEKLQIRRVQQKYQKLVTDLEIERRKRLEELKRSEKKTQNNASGEERRQKTINKRDAYLEHTDVLKEYDAKRRDAKKLEKEIMDMSLEEMAERSNQKVDRGENS